MKKILIVIIILYSCRQVTGQIVDPKVMPSSGGTLNGGGCMVSFTLGETFYTTLNTSGISLKQGFQRHYIELQLMNLKAYIEGFYSGLGMMDNSGSGGCLYLNGSSNFLSHADTVIVSAMDAATLSFVGSAKGIIQTDGNLNIKFEAPVYEGIPYYIKVNHRNTIETWSAHPILFKEFTSYDFTSAMTQAYGNNMTETFDHMGWAFYSGDISSSVFGVGFQDGVVESQDYSDMENAIAVILAGYYSEDITGDNIVESADYSLMENNVFFVISSVTP